MLHSRTIQAVAILFGALFPIVGCMSGSVDVGADDQQISAPQATDDSTCTAFCAIAEPMGCPLQGDCMEVCERQDALAPKCTKELGAELACIAPHLDKHCGDYLFAPDDIGQCDREMIAYTGCVEDDRHSAANAWSKVSLNEGDYGIGPASPSGGRWDMQWTNPARGTVEADCSWNTGVCTCSLNGRIYDHCEALLNWDEDLNPTEMCCATNLLRQPIHPSN